MGNHGRRFAHDFTLLGPAVRATATANQQREAEVASNGTDYLVAWLDYRADSGDSDVFAARIAADGTIRNSR